MYFLQRERDEGGLRSLAMVRLADGTLRGNAVVFANEALVYS